MIDDYSALREAMKEADNLNKVAKLSKAPQEPIEAIPDISQQEIAAKLYEMSENLDAYHNEIREYHAAQEAHRADEKEQTVIDTRKQHHHNWIVAIVGGTIGAVIGTVIGTVVLNFIITHC